VGGWKVEGFEKSWKWDKLNFMDDGQTQSYALFFLIKKSNYLV
jgi:hypothetical protein